ncbi:transposable element gene [Prunus dulcis]|uniref:Transposable element protein n=1 Tax=Prunus dulcis TaxID=3755 RepID=A0A4Y1QS24_PRUDU|nr:transposable element gene [Prunus dulcis]
MKRNYSYDPSRSEVFLKINAYKSKGNNHIRPANLIEGSGRAQIMLPNGTILSIPDALYSSNSRRNLLSFKDIRLNGYHVETKKEENMEYLCITSSDTQKRILEKLCELSSGLYYTTIRTIEAHSIMDQESTGSNAFKLWHDRGEKSVSKEQGKLIPEKRHELSWNVSTLSHLDPHTAQCENEVRRIVHLQSIANQMPDAFNDAANVTKSHIPAANAPARIDVHDGQSNVPANGSSAARLKRGRPLGSKDSVPRKRKLMDKMNPNEINREPTIHNSNAPKEGQVLLDKENVIGETSAPKVATVPESQEISINYTSTDELWSRNEMIIDDIFAFSVAAEIIKDDDIEPSVFGHIIPTPPNVNPVGYKWVFTRKRNEKNEISRYKARLVAQGFSQRPGIDYVETYSPVMDTITFRYLISLAVSEKLEMRLMDVITAYLYGELDTDIYMKFQKDSGCLSSQNKPRGMFSVKLRNHYMG